MIPIGFMKAVREFSPHVVKVLTWGGLRGGLAFAMALSIPHSFSGNRDVLLASTYVVVVFSILVQGLSMKRLLRSRPAG